MKININLEPRNFWAKTVENGEFNDVLFIGKKIHKLMKLPKKETITIKGMRELHSFIEKENEDLTTKLEENTKCLEEIREGKNETKEGFDKSFQIIRNQLELIRRDEEIEKEKGKQTSKGGKFEEELINGLRSCFLEDEIRNMSKISRGADIRFIEKGSGLNIAIEAKNYTAPLPKKEIDKFVRDLNGMDDIVWGILISKSPITSSPKIELRKLTGEKTKFMWLVFENENPINVLTFLILTIKKMNNLLKSKQLPSSSDFDKDAFNEFVNEQLAIYRELIKTLEIVSEKKYIIQKTLDDMIILVKIQKKKFEEALSKLGDFIVLEPQEKIRKKDFMIIYPKSVDIIKKLNKQNFKLSYGEGGVLEYHKKGKSSKKRYIRFEKNRYIIYGEGFEKNNVINFGNETLLSILISDKF
jgi:hypothetical protein